MKTTNVLLLMLLASTCLAAEANSGLFSDWVEDHWISCARMIESRCEREADGSADRELRCLTKGFRYCAARQRKFITEECRDGTVLSQEYCGRRGYLHGP